MMSPAAKYMNRFFLLTLFILFFCSLSSFAQKKYIIHYIFPGKDTSYKVQQFQLKTIFDAKGPAREYITSLPKILLSSGFPAASIDSVFYDSTYAEVRLYPGKQYKWAHINTDSIEPEVLNSTGWNEKQFDNRVFDFSRLQAQQERIMNYYGNTGYPFAEVSLQDIHITGDKISGSLDVKKGYLYHFDSIRVFGNVKIKNLFLQHYLGLLNGSVYNNEKLKQVSKLIQELPFLQEQQPWKVTMLGTGAYLNLYLQPKRSSQINVLVGFLPSNSVTRKSQLTADVHLDLNNTLGLGENILLNWQQLQPQSPKLNLGYSQPYILHSNFGISLSFDLLKKDSSYLQLNSVLALQYMISSGQMFKIFYQNQNSYLLSGGVDTSQVKYSRTLPVNIDVSSGNFGIGYQFVNTNYRLNPRKGTELEITASAGIKRTSKNNDIVNLKDPADPLFNYSSLYDSILLKTYRISIVTSAAHYFPFGKNNTLKTAVNAGFFQSPQTFRNELFRIGGYKLLRGFDEESIYANQYAVFTAEYRYLVGINSYFFGFSDVGFTNSSYQAVKFSNSYISGGVGLAFETKFGLLNLSYAAGKRNDVKFDIRNSSRIHFGYINYF